MSHISVNETLLANDSRFITEAIDLAGVGVVITDPLQPDNPIVYVNKGFEDLTGYTRHEITGQNCRFLQKGTATEAERKDMREKMAAGERVQIVLKNFRKDGTPFWNELDISKVHIEDLGQSFFIGIQKDITRQVEAEKQAEQYLTDVRKLSLPIIPADENMAIVPVLGQMNFDRQQELLDKVGKYLEETKKEILILDVSGGEGFDEQMNWTIYALNQMVNLMGGRLILTGISPQAAVESTKGHYDLKSIPTYKDVETAIRSLKTMDA